MSIYSDTYTCTCTHTARALFRHLQWRYHGDPWPSTLLHSSDLLNHFLRRINEASVSVNRANQASPMVSFP